VVPENIHTHPVDGHWKFQAGGGGGSQNPTFLKESIKLNQTFLRGGVFKQKTTREPHNIKTSQKLT